MPWSPHVVSRRPLLDLDFAAAAGLCCAADNPVNPVPALRLPPAACLHTLIDSFVLQLLQLLPVVQRHLLCKLLEGLVQLLG
jgi:hypothetical protein